LVNSEAWLFNRDETRFAAAEVHDLQQQFFTAVFPKLVIKE
jgi:hypothetical protein